MRHRSAQGLLLFVFVSIGAGCSSDSGGGSGDGFQLPQISLPPGAIWKVNQEIVFTFSKDVDFSTVSLNTISIQTATGAPATGSFSLRGPRQVVFQPSCPQRADLTDSGLQAGGVGYTIRVPGRSSGVANTVRSTSGELLEVTQTRSFTTPIVANITEAFLDTKLGPPAPIVRAQGSLEPNATYLEIGGDPDERVYFELDPAQNIVLSVPGFKLPLNLYSDQPSHLAVVIEFDQALNPSSTNISSELMHLEFFDNTGTWQPLITRVSLAANCTETGARVRLEPVGILPQGSQVRAVVLAGLTDLVGEVSPAGRFNFAVAETRLVEFSSLTPADDLADEFPESFDFGGTSTLSFQDTQVLSASPSAEWGDGLLTAAFQFDGTGGPGGTFDLLVEDGDTVRIVTDNGPVLGADGSTVQFLDEGRLNVRNLTIEEGGEVLVEGTFPLRIDATGDVIIRGLLDLSGESASDVIVPNTGNVPELGGRGGPGGGRGGNASEVTTNSTPIGGAGQGPGTVPNTGGGGGESGFAAPTPKDSRRPGGGAGGRFAQNEGASGTAGSTLAKSAIDPQRFTPRGGAVSSGPFVDGITTNNFLGTKAVAAGGVVTSLVRGELTGLMGGFGGGGGGNANPATTFPTPNWGVSSDEKGGAGGGGGGGLHLRALGKIQFGDSGQIRCNGGRGGVGENVENQDHVGGNGGSGSGGHIILETASFIDFTDGGLATTTAARNWLEALGGPTVTGPTPSPGGVSVGGAGGSGVIQIHVPNSISPPNGNQNPDIILPGPVAGVSDPIDALSSPKAHVLVPAFSAHSLARSDWIPLGGASQTPGGPPPSPVNFRFAGTDIALGANEGKILASGGKVQELAPLLDQDLEGNPNFTVLADRVTLRITGTSLDVFDGLNDLYLRTPALLEGFIVRLSVAAESQDFPVVSAVYAEGALPLGDESLSLTVSEQAGDLVDFINANTALGVIHVELVPRYFRVLTDGVDGALPSTAFVRVRFQGARDDGSGAPDAANPLVDWTGDISQFNAVTPGELQFFRFEVEFDLSAGAPVSAGTQPISLDFLRIPFVF